MLTLESPTTAIANDRITAEAAAQIAGLQLQSFYAAIRKGHVPPGVYFRIGRTIRVSRSRLTDWLNAGGDSHAA